MAATDERFRVIAERTAREWAQEVLRDEGEHTAEEQTVAAVVLDLSARLARLEPELDEQRRLARNLGADMLYALQTAYVDDDPEDTLERALLYLARGWKREGERIHLHDCTEGLAVSAALPDTSAVE